MMNRLRSNRKFWEIEAKKEESVSSSNRISSTSSRPNVLPQKANQPTARTQSARPFSASFVRSKYVVLRNATPPPQTARVLQRSSTGDHLAFKFNERKEDEMVTAKRMSSHTDDEERESGVSKIVDPRAILRTSTYPSTPSVSGSTQSRQNGRGRLKSMTPKELVGRNGQHRHLVVRA